MDLFIKIAVPIMTLLVIPMITWGYTINGRMVRVEVREERLDRLQRQIDKLETKIDDLSTFLLRVHGSPSLPQRQ